jgi:sugar phosphate isomerase/epimerase
LVLKLAYSTNAYKKSTLEEAVDSIAGLGYAGVELMADVPHAYPPEMGEERLGRLRAQLIRRNLPISNINAFTLFAKGDTYHPTWIEDDVRLVGERIEHTKNVIRMAGELGAKTISLQPGGPLGHIDRETGLRRYEAGLRECLPLAKECGVVLMVEPEPGLLIQRWGECMEFLERVGDENLKMNCDLGHFYCVGEDPAEVVRKCAKWIAHIHVEDILENRVHQHRIPGEGAMDWEGIFAAVGEVGYAGWLTVELYPYETTAEEAGRKALGFLKKFI